MASLALLEHLESTGSDILTQGQQAAQALQDLILPSQALPGELGQMVL